MVSRSTWRRCGLTPRGWIRRCSCGTGVCSTTCGTGQGSRRRESMKCSTRRSCGACCGGCRTGCRRRWGKAGERGGVVEAGSPEELASRPGSRYRQLLDAEHAVRRGLWASASWRRLWVEGGKVEERQKRGAHV